MPILDIIHSVSATALNITSIAALLAAAWWFYRRGALSENLVPDLQATALGNIGAEETLLAVLEVQNAGEREAWIAQVVISCELIEEADAPLGAITTEPSGIPQIFQCQREPLSIGPKAIVRYKVLSPIPSSSQICILRYFIFPGRTTVPIGTMNDLEEMLSRSGNNYFFDEAVVDRAQVLAGRR